LQHKKVLIVKSTMFLHRDIHKYTWTSPDEETHKKQRSNIVDVRFLEDLTVILTIVLSLQTLDRDYQ